MMITRIKDYLIGILLLLVSVLGIGLKVSGSRRRRAVKRAESSEATTKHHKDVLEKKTELDKNYRSHKAEIAKEIEENKHTTELSDPNRDWL